MRKGQNPYKTTDAKIRAPEKITIGMPVHIPSLTGYYREMLDVLKVCVNSIIENTDIPFDLIIMDNNSCEEVKSYLRHLLTEGMIDYLILNKRNIGKPNAAMMLLESARGEIIVLTDCDIKHEKGWIKAYMEIMKNFPNAGLIGGYPSKNFVDYYTKSTFEWIRENEDKITIEKGNLVEKDWMIDYLHSIGKENPEDDYNSRWKDIKDVKITVNNVSAFVGATHMQYMTKKEYVKKLSHLIFDSAIGKGEHLIDEEIDKQNLIRLSTHRPYVRHLGNTIKTISPNQHNKPAIKTKEAIFAKVRKRLRFVKKIILRILVYLNKIIIGLIDTIQTK